MRIKKAIVASVIIASTAILIALSVLYFITKSFVVNSIFHIFLKLLLIPIVIKIIQKCFMSEITNSMKKFLVLCGCIITLDLVVVDAVRFIFNNGNSPILFLPACLPICFIIAMYYSSKDTGKDKRDVMKSTYIVGIPLLILSLYFEVLSFIQI